MRRRRIALKHKYLNLNMGLVEENFAIIKRKDMKIWQERGFEKIRRYPVFGYIPKITEVIMLGRPLTMEQFGVEKFPNSKIVDYSVNLGTYGMGGPGFFGIKVQGDFGIRWLVYCIWSAGEHILLDNRILECHSKYASKYKPWINFDKQSESQEEVRNLLKGSVISEVILAENDLTITFLREDSVIHTLNTKKASNKFPEQGGTGKKRKSYEKGSMGEYWLVIYDGTELSI